MAEPAGAARHAREALKSDGTAMIVWPFAGDRVEDNLNPIGRTYITRHRRSSATDDGFD